MDITFVLFAIISTLLAIVVATSLFNGSSPAADFANARSYFGHRDGVTRGLDQSGPKQNGHLPDKKKKKEADDWCEISGSSHDHWDVVKSVLSVSSLSVIRLSFSVNTDRGLRRSPTICFTTVPPTERLEPKYRSSEKHLDPYFYDSRFKMTVNLKIV